MMRNLVIMIGLLTLCAESTYGQDVTLPAEYLKLFEKEDKDVRKWGASSDGFAVSLELDETDYEENAIIVAHLACVRFTEGWEMWGREKIDTELCSPQIEIKDSKGIPVVMEQNYTLGEKSLFKGCSGVHAGGLDWFKKHVEEDKVIHNEMTINNGACLNRRDVFPGKPGTYTITAIWSPAKDISVRSIPATFSISRKK